MRLFRTDLAVESAALFREQLPQGVEVEEYQKEGVKVSSVRIFSQEGASQLGKAPGRYVTVELPPVSGSVAPSDDVTHLVAQELSSLLPPEGSVLVVGLGNEQMTPDALGPRTARQILVTRHIPAQIARQTGLGQLRPVAALATGVLGQTGIETGELVRSVVRDLSPAAVIVVDALAARSLSRLGNTIQMADAGISPGSGVQNARKELSRETLGVPVISMGIPTVVDGATLACDLLGGDERNLTFQARSMMVTPRDIDAVIERGAKHLSLAINAALHPRLSLEDITYLVS